uniref:Protein ZIP4 homolog n=1 Tax=Trypanosoma vivax (strain Y486) TaxID=1055687 RepID=G0U4B0_TRYVY|nr:conserved hypothetical protein [Trypanosoma vivax Y486]
MTMRHTDRTDDEMQRIKALLRDLATRAFLLGNYVFCGEEVRHTYFVHHLREAEQCILMCLRTARDLSLCDVADDAMELLVVGESIASHIPFGAREGLTHLRYRNINWEFQYTTMEVTWNLSKYHQSCEAAEKLVQALKGDNALPRALRESFFRFVFTIGNTSSMQPEGERFLRNMLTLSLSVQDHIGGVKTSDSSHHLPTLRGTTAEQMALSWLRDGEAKEAMHWSEKADAILHSNATALLRLKATAEAGMEQEAVALLYEYVQRQDAVVDDAVSACFELHKLLTTLKGRSVEAMRLLQGRMKNTEVGQHVTFRCIQLLLLHSDAESCQIAMQMMRGEGVTLKDAKYRRHCFLWLWELSDTASSSNAQVIESLETAACFLDCASDIEKSAVTLRLCSEYITHYEAARGNDSLIRAKQCAATLTEASPRCAFAHMLLFKISVLEGSDMDLIREVQCLATCEPEELVVPALCTAVNYCLQHNHSVGASLASAQAVFHNNRLVDAPIKLQLLKVYVCTVLGNMTKPTGEQLLVVAEQFQQLILKNSVLTLSHDEVSWWTKAFLLLASEFDGETGATSIALFHSAALTAMHDPAPNEGDSRMLLTTAILCTLEDEFLSYVTGRAHLELHVIDELLRTCKDIVSLTPTPEGRLTILLAEAECQLRQPSSHTYQSIEALLHELDTVPAAYDDYEALGEAASIEASRCLASCPQLHSVAARVFIHTASKLIKNAHFCIKLDGSDSESTADYIVKILFCIYRAFVLAPDRREQVFAANELTALLTLTVDNTSTASYVKRLGSTEVKATSTNSTSYLLLYLEYFTVEAWNNSIFYLNLDDDKKQDKWAKLAWMLVETLPTNNAVGTSLLALRTINK